MRLRLHAGGSNLAVGLAAGLALTACASSKLQRKDKPRGGTSTAQELYSVPPVALALTGFAWRADGVVVLSDIGPQAGRQFDDFDTDRSGQLSAIEHGLWAEVMLGDPYGRPTLRMMDRDLSQGVSRGEFVLAMEEAGDRFDTNGDGRLVRSELLVALPQGRRRSTGGEGGGESDRGGEGRRPPRGR